MDVIALSNLSRLRRTSTREGYKAAKSIKYSSGSKKEPKIQKTFLEYILTDGDTMVIADPRNMIPNWVKSDNQVFNDRFTNKLIRADKIALIYSQKKKLFMYITICDDIRTCAILFKNKELYQLPDIRIAELNQFYHLAENSNRLMNCIIEDLWDCTSNPIMRYLVGELFRK